MPYEEDLLKAPYAIGLWLRYLEHKGSAPPAERFILYERAVRRTTAERGAERHAVRVAFADRAPAGAHLGARSVMPASYKLWKLYLDERRRLVEELPLDHPQYEALNQTYERALVHLHKVRTAARPGGRRGPVRLTAQLGSSLSGRRG